MGFFDLSLRHKIPLWGSFLILVSTLAISTVLLFRAYEDMEQDLFISSESLGQTLAKTLFPALLHDDLWRAFEIVQTPFHADAKRNPHEPDMIFVLNPELKILVASDPKQLPTLAELDGIGPEHRQLAALLRESPPGKTRAFDIAGSRHYYFATPIAAAGNQVGTLVIGHSRDAIWGRFFDLAIRSVLIGGLVVAIILPLNWYWGQRVTRPLVDLARRMVGMVHGDSVALGDEPSKSYPYRDELGQLFDAYDTMRGEMRIKARMEQEIMQAERLAAIGQLAAGIAHEVNNPLGGMLMALDNLKQRGAMGPATAKTVGLLQRGLQQVADTIGALLVEARVTSRPLTRHDFDDIHTLIEPQADEKSIELGWRVDLPQSMDLPAGSVRQVLINLLLNAIRATASGGWVELSAGQVGNAIELTVANVGDPIPDLVRAHLFEPFASDREGGHGLGLWVTYQTVTQLGGQIVANSASGEVRFTVTLPLGQGRE